MNSISEHTVPDEFSSNWMAWLVVHHFLPARLLRDLGTVVVREFSQGATQFSDLFDEVEPAGPFWNERWVIRPRRITGARNIYLQMFIRSLVWQSDEGGYAEHAVERRMDKISPQLLDALVRLGAADLNWSVEAIDAELEPASGLLQDSVKAFLAGFRLALKNYATMQSSEFWQVIGTTVEAVDMPLRSVLIKHFADLCADVDDCDKARHGYLESMKLLENWAPGSSWSDLTIAWKGIFAQSLAAVEESITSPILAAEILEKTLTAFSLRDNPLLVANASFDSFVASMSSRSAGDQFFDNRVGILDSPLLQSTHDDSQAVGKWLSGKYQDANRYFWATLRRQIALGAATEGRTTKVSYARNLFEELKESSKKNTRPETFRMAVRLLVEGINPDAVTRIPWQDAIVLPYVDDICVQSVIAHADAYGGNKIRREMVVVELFKEWIRCLPPDRSGTAIAMLRHVALLARDFEAEFDSSIDLGRRSLRALRDIATKRPELRHEAAKCVGEAILRKLLSEGAWWGKSEALETAREYAEEFDKESMSSVVEATINVLKSVDPERDQWPLVRPAIEFLLLEPVRTFAKGNPGLNDRILDQILRIGLHQASEHTRLFSYLRRIDPNLLKDADIQRRVQEPLENARRAAGEINSSNATGSIYTLLTVPATAGHEGIRDGLDALVRILESVGSKHESIGLPFAYEPLLLLASNLKDIRENMGGHEEYLEATLEKLLNLVVAIWETARVRPVLFAPMGFPPSTRPDHVVVHNWAFASMRFAEALGHTDRVDDTLSGAATQPELSGAINLARATRSTLRMDDKDILATAKVGDREEFYEALGRCLVVLHKRGGKEARELCTVLVEQCLRFGPRHLDVAVFLVAARMGPRIPVADAAIRNYFRRLDGERDLGLALRPILGLLVPDEHPGK